MGAADRIADTLLRIGQIQGDSLSRSGDIQARAMELAAQARAGGVTGSADALARATAANGQIWGQTLVSLGQLPGQVMQQARQNKASQQEATIRQLQIDQATHEAAGQKALASNLQGDQLAPGATGPRQESYLGADGLFDVPKITQALSSGGFGDIAPGLVKGAESINDSITKHQAAVRQAQTAQTVLLGDAAYGVKQMIQSGTPIDRALDFVSKPMIASKSIDPQQYEQVKQQILQLPDSAQQGAFLANLMDAGSKAAGGGETLSEGAVRADRYGRTVASNPKPAPQPTPSSIAMAGAAGDPTAIKANQLLHPTAEKTPTEFTSFQNSYAANQAGIGKKWDDLTPQQQLAGIEKFKTMSTDVAAVAAADRQATAIKQQTDQQSRAQSFAEQQAGRKELTEKVEQPYQDAVEKASTLRSVIDAAKNGNMAAANVQSLLGTLGLVTMEGVKRINTTELNQVAGAGSLLERIKSQVGGLVAGKPLSERLQQDLSQLSTLLEQSARQKYEAGFGQVTKRYNLADEQMIPAGGGTQQAAPAAPSGWKYVPKAGGGWTAVEDK